LYLARCSSVTGLISCRADYYARLPISRELVTILAGQLTLVAIDHLVVLGTHVPTGEAIQGGLVVGGTGGETFIPQSIVVGGA
jgi:hypothetical protein